MELDLQLLSLPDPEQAGGPILEPFSPEGQAVLAWLEHRKVEKLEVLARPHLEPDRTQFVRGELKTLNKLSALIKQTEDNDGASE